MTSKLLKGLGWGLLILVLLLALPTALHYDKIRRLQHVLSLFEADRIVDNFLHMDTAFPTHKISRSSEPRPLARGPQLELPAQFRTADSTVLSQDFLDATGTTGLLVLHRDSIVFENYYRGHSAEQTHISWSVGKSMVSALMGIALAEGHFASIEDPITQYVSELKGSGYEGVSIKNILQMSSGVRFEEDYADFYSDINRFGRSFALGSSLDEFSTSLVNERPPGSYHHYVSINTQVLGMLLVRTTGRSLSDYLEEKIWHPLGMEGEAQWIIDDAGMELALGGLNARLRDYARFGQLYLHQGRVGDRQIVPQQWVLDSTRPDAPHLEPGDNPLSAHRKGYGYHWWIPERSDGDFVAIGVYNQYIYVDPHKDLVVVKNSANVHYEKDYDRSQTYSIDFFRAIGATFPDRVAAATPVLSTR